MILFWAASEWRHGGAHVNICRYRWTMLILERRYILKISTSEHCLLLSLSGSCFSTGKGRSPFSSWGLSSPFVFTPSWVIISSMSSFFPRLLPSVLLQQRSDDSGETFLFLSVHTLTTVTCYSPSAGRISSLWVSCSSSHYSDNTELHFCLWNNGKFFWTFSVLIRSALIMFLPHLVTSKNISCSPKLLCHD